MTGKIKKGLSLLLVCCLLLTLLPVAVFAQEAPTAQATASFIITNPYEDVDWAAFGQYRAALHVHTTRSDGSASVRDTVFDHFHKGFDILAITDHDVLHSGDWADGGPGALTPAERDAILDGTFAGPFPGIYTGSRTQENGMIWLSNANEQSRTQHINTFWAPFSNVIGDTMEATLAQTEALGGVAILNHPGRYTGGMAGGVTGIAASNNPGHIARYVELFDRFPVALGFELFNRLDNESRSDRILWDNVLTELMPYGRPVWGFSNDDSHSMEQAGYNWNVMLLPELTEAATKTAMETGAFYMVSRVTRGVAPTEPGINNTGIPSGGTADTIHMLSQTTPGIDNIEVGVDTITLTGRDYTEIEWIADGEIIATGASLDLTAYEDYINSYVRAQLRSAYGIAMTQPFGIREVGTEVPARPANDLTEIEPSRPRIVRNGAEPTVAGLRLPQTVTLITARGWHTAAEVTWNLDAIDYDPAITAVAQTFAVTGTVTLPDSVTNGLGLPLTTTVAVTVNEWRDIVITPIAEAHELEVGESVVVRGLVTGFYEPSQGADGSFYLRDGSGSTDAILVRLTTAAAPPTPGARSFVGQYVEVEGVRRHPGDGNGFINVSNITVDDPFLDILVIDPIEEIPTEPTPVELVDLLDAGYRSQFVSLERIMVIPARTGPAMPLSNWLLGDPATGLPLVLDAEGNIIAPENPIGQNLGGISFTLNFSADYEALGYDRPLDYPTEPVWITVPAANIHFWNARNEVQIRLTDPIESWAEITVEPPVGDFPFDDVPEDVWGWARPYIQLVYDIGLMQGTAAATFDPEGTFTRAMLAATLWRAEGEPEAAWSPVFTDVPEDAPDWYRTAIIWAYENEIVRGIGGGRFAPYEQITREQFAGMLARYVGGEAPEDFVLDFPDVDQVSDWALDYMRWANYHDLIRGTGDGLLDPLGTMDRAHAAVLLARFITEFMPDLLD